MAKRELPSPEVLRQLLRYEPETGKLFWKERGPEWFEGWGRGKDQDRSPSWRADRWNKRYPAFEAGCLDIQSGYVRVSIFDYHLYAHRIAWVLSFGEIDDGIEVDHIDGNRGNNVLGNLRLVSVAGNAQNTRLRSHNASGSNGVFWNNQKQKWHARVQKNGKVTHLGFFEDKDAAIDARGKADRLMGFSAMHGSDDRPRYKVAKE